MSSDEDYAASSALNDDKEDSPDSKSETISADKAFNNDTAKKQKGKKAAPAKTKKKVKSKAPVVLGIHTCSLAYDSNKFFRSACHDYSKHVDTINFIINKDAQQKVGTSTPSGCMPYIWNKIEKDLGATNQQMTTITKNQIMAMA